jgi:hypothetical protein
MIASEVILKKKLTVLLQFINILNTFFTKHGKKHANFLVLANFLLRLKNTPVITPTSYKTSGFLKFYNFISKLTPRLNIVSVENKKAGKVFKIPMPPLKNSILQHNFLINYARAIKNVTDYKNFPNQLFQSWLDATVNEKGELFRQKQTAYEILKEHKFRARKRHDKLIKIKKIPTKNAVKKDKQFYI